jgi:hypothetical protein
MTSRPAARSSRARCVTAELGDGLIRSNRGEIKGATTNPAFILASPLILSWNDLTTEARWLSKLFAGAGLQALHLPLL